MLVALTVGLVFWIAAWAFGIKAFDAFLLTVALWSARRPSMSKPFVDQLLGRERRARAGRGLLAGACR